MRPGALGCSSTAEPLTVNQAVAGSNPATPASGPPERGGHALTIGGTTDRPDFTEINSIGNSCSNRFGTKPRLFLLHTQEGNGTAQSLASYLNNSYNGVSYHYTVRDRTVVDVVNTDYASWSVLDANSYSINLCFAGSRSSWSRAQWLSIEADIEIAAYLAVQDCRKYGIPIRVIAPPYNADAGISDHRYVTDYLGIGDHTDVGPNFPWDKFKYYVDLYAGTGGDAPLSAAEVKHIEDFIVGFVGPIGSDVKDIREQLTGGRDYGEYPGWDQLGDQTLVDAVAELRRRVDEIASRTAPK